MIRVGCDRVGVEVRGGRSSGGSVVVLCGRAVYDAGVVSDSARAEMSAGTSWKARVSKGGS